MFFLGNLGHDMKVKQGSGFHKSAKNENENVNYRKLLPRNAAFKALATFSEPY